VSRYAAIYCRLSPRPDGSYEGVEAQEDWGRVYAAKHWPGVPVRVYRDKGISAANGDTRPGYEALRAAVAAGQVAHLWCVEQSRLERREAAWFTLAAELDGAGITEVHTNRDGIVRVRDEVAGIKAVLAAAEVRRSTMRVNDRLARNAANGDAPGSLPFGYRRATDEQGHSLKTYEVEPEQAQAIRDAAERVLRGWSLGHVAAELHSRGLRGAHGGKLTHATVRNMITNPTVAGKRVHRGVIVGDGNWPAILDEGTWQACKAKVSGGRVVQRSDGGVYPVPSTRKPAARRYLLTGGLAVCGVCGAKLIASEVTRRGKRFPLYQCHPNVGGKACIGIMAQPLEDHVRDELLAALDKPAFLELLSGAEETDAERERLMAALAGIERQRRELAALWTQPGELTLAEWQTARDGLAEGEAHLHAALAELPAPLVDVEIGQVRDAWPNMTLDERREIIRLFIESVTIKRAVPGTRGFDSGRVAISWRNR
jgi:DNA invertase Pin-like site-specific DNA recombinase